MSARKSRRSSPRACSNQDVSLDDEDNSSSSSQGSPGEGADTLGLVGRLVAKYRRETLLHGVVKKYNKAAGKGESWTVSYNDEPEPDKIGRKELEKQLRLQMQTTESESPLGPAMRGRGRPRKSKNSPAKRQAATPPRRDVVKKQRAATSSSLVAKATPKNGKGKGKLGGSDSVELQSASYKGKRVAEDFHEYGIVTGEVVKVKSKGTLFSVMFEDGYEVRDYNVNELEKHMALYQHLVDRFEVADTEDEATDSETDDDAIAPSRKGKGKGKGKEKGKGKGKAARGGGGANANHIGARVRVFFPTPSDDFFNGTVTKHRGPEPDDKLGDLYHVIYDDGDAEDLNSKELEQAMATFNHNELYPLVKKKVSISTGTKKEKEVTLFGENRAGSPIFSTVRGFHVDGRFKKIP